MIYFKRSQELKKIDFGKFDILGFFELKDNHGIEELTTPLSDGKFLSRNMNYYSLKSCKECSIYREYCKSLLQDVTDIEKKFVIFENMLNCSAKVFYNEIKNKVRGLSNSYETAKKCFEEDCCNLMAVMSGEKNKCSDLILPDSDDAVEERQIELDNKALLALFCSNLQLKEDDKVLLTGLGGLYLGVFCKMLYGCDYAIAPLSYYAGTKDLLEYQNLNLRDYLSQPEILDGDNQIVFLDDNMGTGATMKKIAQLLSAQGKQCKFGAVQFNWINYRKVETGEKDIDRFNICDIDFLTKFNYPGNKLLKHAIHEHLVVSGDDYIQYIKSKSYRLDDQSDLVTLAERGEKNANICGVYFDPQEHSNIEKQKRVSAFSRNFIEKLDVALTQLLNK